MSTAIILAGGKGTRLKSFDPNTPKPLIKVNGKPVLFHQIDHFKKNGVGHVTVLAGYKGEQIKEVLHAEYGSYVDVIIESSPLGTGGALALVRDQISVDMLVVSGDLIFDFDVGRLLDFHKQKKSDATLVVHPNTHPRDSDLVEMTAEGRVKRMLVRPHPSENFRYRNMVNASVMVLGKKFWQEVIPVKPRQENFEKDTLARALAKKLNVFAYTTPEYIKDMGTPDRLKRAEEDLQSGLVEARSLRNKQRAVFIDRDGTLVKHKDYIIDPADIELESYASEAIQALNKSPYLTILITNQPQVAMNMCSMEQIEEVHKQLETILGDQGLKLDDIFFCPHHPEKGHANEIKELKIDCSCRKPKPGLLLQAAEKYNIDLAKSWMIGDASRDVLAGKNAGTKTIVVKTGLGGTDGKYEVKPDYTSENLWEAVKLLQNGEN